MFNENTTKSFKEWLLAAVISVSVFLLINYCGFRIANINGESMEPTFYNADRCVLWVSAYWFKEPEYGDVIVFPYPPDKSEKYVKRVAGKGGDVIDFKDGALSVNGKKLENGETSLLGSVLYPLVVPDGAVFVLGDNINASKDSRDTLVGCIPKEDITGKVIFRLWPFKKAGFIN